MKDIFFAYLSQAEATMWSLSCFKVYFSSLIPNFFNLNL